MIPTLLRVNAALGALAAGAAMIAAAAVLFACFAISWAVVARGAVGFNTVWELEASIYLLIYAAFLGAAFAHRRGGQIAVEFLRERLTGRARRIHRTLLDLVALGLFALLAVSGWEMFHRAWESGWRSETLWGPPLWIPYAAIPLGGALMCLTLVTDIALRVLGEDLPHDLETDGAH